MLGKLVAAGVGAVLGLVLTRKLKPKPAAAEPTKTEKKGYTYE